MENMAILEPKIWSDERLGWCYGDEGNGQRRAGWSLIMSLVTLIMVNLTPLGWSSLLYHLPDRES